MRNITKAAIRHGVSLLQRVRRSIWFLTRPSTVGVRAVVLTPQGRVVLVRHTYTPGWYLPGGGRKKGETPEAAILRELREEIGMTTFDSLRPAGSFQQEVDFKADSVAVFLVQGVGYAPPRWSLEIDAVDEFDPRALPADTTPRTRADITLALHDPSGDAGLPAALRAP